MLPIAYLFEFVTKEPTTRVRGELYIMNEGKLLVGESFNSGNWSIPGGAVDSRETPQTAAIRETLEEVGVKVKNIKPLNKTPHVTDFIRIYGSWDNVPIGVSIWGHDRLETYSFQGDYDGEDKRLWRSASDRRGIIWVTPKDYEMYIKKKVRNLRSSQRHLVVRMSHSLKMLKLLYI